MKITQILFLLLASYSVSFSQSVLEINSFYSPSLGIEKSYYIYLPDGYYTTTEENYPSIYFLRQREDEWFNLEFRTGTKTLKDILDELIENGEIKKMIVIGANTGGEESLTRSGIVNMLRPDLTDDIGIGTGKFEDYFFCDLIPHIDSTYRTIPLRCARGLDGFSFGGYASTLYGFKHPSYFTSIGSYDGTIMWDNIDDELSTYFNPSFINLHKSVYGSPLDTNFMKLNSAIHILQNSDSIKIKQIKDVSFHISATSNPDHTQGNLFANQQLINEMNQKGISNSYTNIILNENAKHHIDWADEHAKITLVRHSNKFQLHLCDSSSTSIQEIITKISKTTLENYPNPVQNFTTFKIENSSYNFLKLDLYNIEGKKIANIINGYFEPNTIETTIDLTNYPNGIYFYVLKSADEFQSNKLIIVK